ncbi:MAG: trypsin-like peptidase domain-containing protein [Candidatus Doudnabacteria bacterium]|nr:trypsin-like peptidase domain-containing protein [Candidatus Doudnabacteria bacterium]
MKEKEKNPPALGVKKVKNESESPPASLDMELDDSPDQSEEKKSKNDQTPKRPWLISDLKAHQDHNHAKISTVSTALAVSLLVGIIGGVVGSIYISPWLKLAVIGSPPGAVSELKKVILDENSAIIEVVKEVNPAVVSIIITKDLPKLEQFFFDPFGNEGDEFVFPPFSFSAPGSELERRQIGAGSGFIATSDGLIVTNKHVVADDKAEYTVITKDGTKYPGRLLAKDPLNDLAIVKIDASALPVANLGDSEKLELGQRVIAIGNTLGELSNTVTTGVVSGLGRTVAAGDASGQTELLQEVIQTDAAINPGNSGGPLLNLAGQVIGVNTAIDRSGQLVGFAIPVSEVKKVLDDVQTHGRVLRPFIGVRYVMVTGDFAQVNKLPADHGALIVQGEGKGETAIVPASPAERAGLLADDIILEINRKRIDEKNSLSRALRVFKPGDQVLLKIQRGSEQKELLLTLGEA